ncbi:cilia- and flagella-associated protein 251-like isoform X2 [Strongylocentrotus purpuratus]|uniref:Uncharacterized protein n=1 Tax=Strongylocentrotus purpuratus TaxID=7668 RepID=A0A7M7T4X7_STRPU|nr:cilia- and flagella-associated protein 251-like isoform X2 [Strongylocentrotus purpuratus]
MKEKKEKEEQRAEAEAERREEEAEDAYLNLKWKEEAKTRPFPLATQCGFPQGSVKGELWRMEEQKKAAKEMKEKKEKEEQRAEAEAERREEEAEDAYLNLKWKEEAKTRPFPLATQCGYPQGSVKGELWRMEEQEEGCKRDEGEEGEGRTKS